MSEPTGFVLINKESGWTSHDVVAKARSILKTRAIGHAGTLDPMATGLLILGVGSATKLLNYLSNQPKTYKATIRLGVATETDDADGEITEVRDASGLSQDQILNALKNFIGEIQQIPSKYSAIKVNGVRSYTRARSGEEFELPSRLVTIYEIKIGEIQKFEDRVDIEVSVSCSSGTYIRAIARDLGELLGVGGHLIKLDRESIGEFAVTDAHKVGEPFKILPMSQVARKLFPVRVLSDAEHLEIAYGRGIASNATDALTAGLAPGMQSDAELVALLENRSGRAHPIKVFQGRN